MFRSGVSLRFSVTAISLLMILVPVGIFGYVEYGALQGKGVAGSQDLIRILGIMGIFLIAGIPAALIFSGYICNALKKADSILKDLEEGRIEEVGNLKTGIRELKALSSGISAELVPKLGKIVSETQTVVRTCYNVNELMRYYEHDIWNMADGIHRDVGGIILKEMSGLNDQITSVSSAVTEILATIESFVSNIDNQSSAVTQTSASIEEMTASINSISRISQEKTELTNVLVEKVETGRRKIVESNNQIKDISADVTGMMNIIGVINNIASQTNLLAMNAAIEAAHAGQYGTGFSVVADEIRKLAESASSNAKIITDSLKEATGRMENVLHAGEESEKGFMEVAESVMDFVNAFSEISRSTSEVSEGSREILAAVNSLTQISQEISEGSSGIAASTKEINNSVESIKSSYEVLTGEVAVIDSRAQDTENSLEDMLKLIEWNDYNINTIKDNAEEFQVSLDRFISKESRIYLKVTEMLVSQIGWMNIVGSAIRGLVEKEAYKEIDVDKARDYQGCNMGVWLSGEGKRLFGNNPVFQEIVEEHKKLHENIARIGENIHSMAFNEIFEIFRLVRESNNTIILKFMQLINEFV